MGLQCDEKTGSFPTGAAARRALARIRRRGERAEEHGKPLRVYPCPRCGRFHLTTEDYEANSRTKGYWEE